MRQHGGPEVLQIEEWDDPETKPGDLLVDVVSAGINFMDVNQRKGLTPPRIPLPAILGAEGAGTVVAVGAGVDDFEIGDRVAWCGPRESYATRVAIPARVAVRVPPAVELPIAAASILQGLTAHCLSATSFPVAEGDVAVVHAAAGGVGLLLTQMVKHRGGIVVATTSSSAKGEAARSAGADRVASYDDFPDVVKEVSGGEGAAVVYDAVGLATFEASLGSLRRRGHLVMYGAASGPVPPFDLRRLSENGSLTITRPALLDFIASRAELLCRTDELFGWIAEGVLTVTLGGTYLFEEAGKAHAELEARRTTGKLLLNAR